MQTAMDFRARWVLVTGASSGLGVELARQLARDHRANLVLVARRRERLAALQEELEAAYGISVYPLVADLGVESDVERVFSEASQGRDIYAVILNAAITHFGDHFELSWPEVKRIIDVNVNAVAQLTHAFVPYLLAKGQGGGVMLVASLAGVTPVPYQSAYSGTKAFLLGFGHGLWHELRGRDVSITTFVPGGIATEMTELAGLGHYFGTGGLFMQSASACAGAALSAFAQRRHTYVPGLVNQVGVLASKLLPRSVMVGRVAAEYRKALLLKRQRSPG
jgi:uncharacterized protein